MKVGLLIEGEEGLTWDQWRLVLTVAERLDFDSVWISDHLQPAWASEPGGLDAWVALTYAAAHTRRVGLGSLVSPVTFRAPAVFARMARNVGALAGGRLTVGLGLGWNAEEHARAGLPFPAFSERAHLLEQQVDLLRGLPLLIGGAGATALELAARFADAWNITSASAEQFTACSERLDALCEQHGRDRRAIQRSIAAGVLIGRDAADLRQRSRRMQERVPPLAEVTLESVPDAARERGWIAGTPREIVASLERLARAGVDLAILGHYDPDDVDALELIAERVLPALS